MSVTSGFFNSLNGDRTYSAEQFSALFDNLITDGVFANVGTAFEVKANGENNITVGIGRAWFNSIWLYNDALLPMVAQDPEVLLNRIDAIVIEVNHNEAVRQASIRWVYGSPSSSPVRPTLTNTDAVHQYPLAYVYRKAGDSTVIQADITNMIGTSACPYVTGILATQDIDKVVAQWESQFYTWFDGLEASLSGDVAANLANQVLDLQSRFQTLAREKAVYEELQDSTGATIQDSNGNDILARTVLGGETVIINYPVGTGGDEVDGFKVGDTLMTMRTDLGINWLLCNGAKVSRIDYSQLSAVVSPSLYETWDRVTNQLDDDWVNTNDADNNVKAIFDGEYYYVACGINNGFRIYRSADLKTWTAVNTRTGLSGSPTILDFRYIDGKYIVIVEFGSVQCCYSTSIDTPLNSWPLVGIIYGLGGLYARGLEYFDGKFILLGHEGVVNETDNCRLYQSTDLSSWSQFASWTNISPHGMAYLNGKYIIFGDDNTTASSPVFRYLVSDSLSNIGSETFANVINEEEYVYSTVVNDTFFLFTKSTKSMATGYIRYTTDLSLPFSEWPVAEMPEWYRLAITSVVMQYIDGYYMIFSGNSTDRSVYPLYFFKEGNFTISYVELPKPSNTHYATLAIAIEKIDNNYRVCFIGYLADVQYVTCESLDISKITLPSISEGDLTRTYIKVRE